MGAFRTIFENDLFGAIRLVQIVRLMPLFVMHRIEIYEFARDFVQRDQVGFPLLAM